MSHLTENYLKPHLRIIFVVLLSSIGLWAAKPSVKCNSGFKAIIESSPNHYEVTDGDFYVSAEVMPSEKGYLGAPVAGRRTLDLNFFLRTKTSRSVNLSGKAEFTKVLEHFEGKFDQIQGFWTASTGKDNVADNLDKFNQLTAGTNALSAAEAAAKTWTGQQAITAGYSKVMVLETKGIPGAYTSVKVLYQKP